MIGQIAGGHRFGRYAPGGKIRMCANARVANGLQRQRFAGQNFRLCFNVIVHVADNVIRIVTLKWKNTCVFAINFNARLCFIDGFHAERCNGYNGHDRQRE